ncbi:UDP-glucosyltransferase 2-like, partial [Phlebotomus argentipes]|uniref:UDP-glucosyltransferase 2-like n=1 Tax=Phlebotomus argentipes TaxID=94469 RepID=UPI002892E650
IFTLIFTYNAARILGVFPTPIRSHFIFATGLLKGLAEEGHQVTVFGSFPLEKPIRNYRYIRIDTRVTIDERETMEKFHSESSFSLGTLRLLANSVPQTLRAANTTLNSREYLEIADRESFDVVFVEKFFNLFLIGLGDHFKCPVILIVASPPTEIINEMSGNPSTAAFVPNFLLGKVSEMTFLDRILNYSLTVAEKVVWIVLNWRESVYYEANFPSPKYRTYEEMKKNVSLFFVNDHFSLTSPRPYLPNVIPVGGLHIKAKPDKLSQELREFIDDAEFGVIIFSLGSRMKTSFLPSKMLHIILKVFSTRPERIIFKWENDSIPELPKNIMIQKWMPQADILAHENVRLFITHCGLGAMNEAKYHGVPIVGIPFYDDQSFNAMTAEDEGWAVILDHRKFSEDSFVQAINEVLGDPKYQNAARRASNLFRDRPMTALQTAIYWTEYVIRHRGASHLKSKAADLLWFQKTSLDVVAVYILLIWISWKIVKLINSSAARKAKKD